MTENMRELNDRELNDANGGGICELLQMEKGPDSYVYNAAGDEIGAYYGSDLYYFPCPGCGRPTHMRLKAFFKCSSCDYRSLLPTFEPWLGTEEGLRAAETARA